MRKRKLVLSLVVLFIAAYVGVGLWIAHDTKVVLEKAMSGAADSTEYMNPSTYQIINPIERGMIEEQNYNFDEKSYHIGTALPLHFFFVSKVFVTQQHENDRFGFKEPVQLTMKLKSGKWYAMSAQIEP